MTDSKQKPFRNLEDFSGMASDWFWETDAEHRFCYFSQRIEEVTKFDVSDLIGRRRDYIATENIHDPKWIAHLEDLNAHRPFKNFEYFTRPPPGGKLQWVRVAGEPQFAKDGTFTGYRGVGHDITAEKTAMQRLEASNAALEDRNRELSKARRIIESSAFEDPLTKLLNRRAFERDIAAALETTALNIGLLHIDLDRFKWVNDTLGHPAGDQVLCAAASRLLLTVGPHGSVYRVGGDEFMIILQEAATNEMARWLGDQIIEAIGKPVSFGAQRVTVGASIGVAIGQSGDLGAQRLVSHADAALYEVKRTGRNAVCCITADLRARIDDERRLAADIPNALKRCEFIPYFQPQIEVATGRIIGTEALVRWNHPERGILAPGQFLKAATGLGVIDQIDRIMLETSLQAVDRMATLGLMLPAISVNVSEARLADPRLLNDIDLFWTNRRCRLSIELLETIYFDETNHGDLFGANLKQLRDMGVGIETDDFGSGRASITGLLKISPDRLKIDRSLVQEVVTSEKKRSLVRAILDMAQALGIECIAEGVETKADINALTELGCAAFQGFAICHPLGEADFIAYLATQKLGPQQTGQTKTAGPKDLPQTA